MNFDVITDNLITNLLLFAYYGAFLVQLFYYWLVFSKLAFYKPNIKTVKQQAVSVVICAKNEYHNLKANLPLILEQDYPDFEVVVVNDASNDDTYYLLKILSEKYPHLKIVNFIDNVNFFRGKKFPLTLGIKSAKNDIVLLTDADCKPGSLKWIDQMQAQFQQGTEIVLGYGKYKYETGFMNKIIRFDTLHIALQYLSMALFGKAYMGVGRNLAYRKSLFYRQNGFINHYKIKSGDDDLFVNAAANKKNCRIMIHNDSHTVSEAKKTFSTWITQKRRHLTSGKYYKFSTKLWLGIYSLSQLIFFITFVSLLVNNYYLLIIIILFLLRLISQIVIFKKAMLKLNEKNFLLLVPVFELFFVVLNPIIVLINSISRPDKWK
ncbi:MAG: glycosyltransferase [Bacteroidetes bacterium]|nr:glycosyltransferase [Bacteroidota bacterium]